MVYISAPFSMPPFAYAVTDLHKRVKCCSTPAQSHTPTATWILRNVLKEIEMGVVNNCSFHTEEGKPYWANTPPRMIRARGAGFGLNRLYRRGQLYLPAWWPRITDRGVGTNREGARLEWLQTVHINSIWMYLLRMDMETMLYSLFFTVQPS